MPSLLRTSSLCEPYAQLCTVWQNAPQTERDTRIQGFAATFAFHSGKLENDAVTLHDTREVFDRGGVSAYTGDVRTLFEIANLKETWDWTLSVVGEGFSFDVPELLAVHRMLTQGTYDRRRWELGERPGEFKRHNYGVGVDSGIEPGDVPEAVDALMEEVREAQRRPHDAIGTLTIAAYLHAAMVNIHPFADGNGRLARQLTNMQLLLDICPPVLVPEGDRMSYFGALDAFHDDDDLLPLGEFLMAESLRSWGRAFGLL